MVYSVLQDMGKLIQTLPVPKGTLSCCQEGAVAILEHIPEEVCHLRQNT